MNLAAYHDDAVRTMAAAGSKCAKAELVKRGLAFGPKETAATARLRAAFARTHAEGPSGTWRH